mmetsp:Transcript_26645/g.88417  ORF Transcript_26645/g.88417 Transcript_26645/m.88417 type:complete len:224 (+) Transcript_26645:1319-1990(+)
MRSFASTEFRSMDKATESLPAIFDAKTKLFISAKVCGCSGPESDALSSRPRRLSVSASQAIPEHAINEAMLLREVRPSDLQSSSLCTLLSSESTTCCNNDSASIPIPLARSVTARLLREVNVLGCFAPNFASLATETLLSKFLASSCLPRLFSTLAKLFSDSNVLGCAGPKTSPLALQALLNKGSASTSLPEAPNDVPRLFSDVRTSGCSGPKTTSRACKARR